MNERESTPTKLTTIRHHGLTAMESLFPSEFASPRTVCMAREIDRLRAALFNRIREDSKCAASGEPPCAVGDQCGCRDEMVREVSRT